MSNDYESTMTRRGWLGKVGALLGAGAVTATVPSCFFDPTGTRVGGNPEIRAVDAGTNPDPELDPVPSDAGTGDSGDAGGDGGEDGGSCEYNNADLPILLFNSMRYDPSHADVQQNMEDQRVYEGGLTLGQLFGSALSDGTAYSAAGFKARYDANENVRESIYISLADKIEDLTCRTEETAKRAVLDELMTQIFDDGTGPYNFRLRDTNAVYFTTEEGNDGEIRGYMLMIGAIAPTDGEQTAEPVILYLAGFDEPAALLSEIEQEGI